MNRGCCVQIAPEVCPGRGCEGVRTVSPRTVSGGTGDAVTLRSLGSEILGASAVTVAGRATGTRFTAGKCGWC